MWQWLARKAGHRRLRWALEWESPSRLPVLSTPARRPSTLRAVPLDSHQRPHVDEDGRNRDTDESDELPRRIDGDEQGVRRPHGGQGRDDPDGELKERQEPPPQSAARVVTPTSRSVQRRRTTGRLCSVMRVIGALCGSCRGPWPIEERI